MTDDVLEALNAVGVPMGVSLTSFATGAALLLDDAKDFGKFEHPPGDPNPTPFHHWLWGTLIMSGGLVGMGLSLMNLIMSDPRVAEGLRSRAEELRIARQALPPEVFERMVSHAKP